jgi:hypothetical protein
MHRGDSLQPAALAFGEEGVYVVRVGRFHATRFAPRADNLIASSTAAGRWEVALPLVDGRYPSRWSA